MTDIDAALAALKEWGTCYSYHEEMRDAAIDAIEWQTARIEKLENLLKPFAQLNANWFGDKIPLQPKQILLDPLPVLYASKYFSEPEK